MRHRMARFGSEVSGGNVGRSGKFFYAIDAVIDGLRTGSRTSTRFLRVGDDGGE